MRLMDSLITSPESAVMSAKTTQLRKPLPIKPPLHVLRSAHRDISPKIPQINAYWFVWMASLITTVDTVFRHVLTILKAMEIQRLEVLRYVFMSVWMDIFRIMILICVCKNAQKHQISLGILTLEGVCISAQKGLMLRTALGSACPSVQIIHTLTI